MTRILRYLRFPSPPLAEQHRIVAKVDELMALCDQLEAARTEREAKRDALAAASLARLNTPDPDPATFAADARFALANLPALAGRPDQIKQLRQTVLNLAMRGRLVKQDQNDEPATKLLNRIDKEERISARRERAGTSLGSPGGSDLPQNWVSTNLGTIALDMRFGTAKKCSRETTGTPVLRIPNVSSGRINLGDLKFGQLTEREAEELSLQKGDLLFIRSNGSLAIVGRATEVDASAEGMSFAGYLVRVRLSGRNIVPTFVRMVMNTDDVRDQIELPIRSAVGLKNINSTELASLGVPLPPLAEQHRIVAKVDELSALCDRLEAGLADGESTRARLLGALLAVALSAEPKLAVVT